jgi:hypothetical protein
METKKKMPLKDYLAGVAIASAIAWLTFGILSFGAINPLTFAYLLLATYLIGSILGGFLVGRKMKQDYAKTGLLTGLFSFIVHVYIFVGVFWIFSVPTTVPLEWHVMVFSVLLLGSCLGVFLSKLIVLGKYETKKSSPE